MLSISGGQWRGVALAAALGVASAVSIAGDAQAAAPSWLRRAFTAHLIGRPKTPAVARYEIDTGGAFTLDRSTPHALMKFDDGVEVWALTVSRGPRGDLIYWNDVRQPILRVTKLGGVTVFTARRPEGSAASMAGASSPLRLHTLGVVALTQRLLQAAVRASRAAQHGVSFEAPEADPGNDALIADAAAVTSEAMTDVAARPGGRLLLARISKVEVLVAREPGVSLRDGVLTISVASSEGWFGRPSSLRVEEALGASPALVVRALRP
jgi:hypothetical protein